MTPPHKRPAHYVGTSDQHSHGSTHSHTSPGHTSDCLPRPPCLGWGCAPPHHTHHLVGSAHRKARPGSDLPASVGQAASISALLGVVLPTHHQPCPPALPSLPTPTEGRLPCACCIALSVPAPPIIAIHITQSMHESTGRAVPAIKLRTRPTIARLVRLPPSHALAGGERLAACGGSAAALVRGVPG